MDLHLREHAVVVTGGASGIGRAVAETFAAEGAHVALWDRSPNVPEVARQIADQFHTKAFGIAVDVTSEATVREARDATVKALGLVDHLVHAAAIGSGKFGFPFTNLKPEDWTETLRVNVMGMVQVAHAWGEHFVARRAGTMIFLASVAGQIGSQTDPPYSASKAANINFAQCLAKDLAPCGIRVNTVCPGMVQTPLNRRVWQAWHDQVPVHERQSYEEWAAAKIAKIVPLGKWQTPQAIADMIVFLSSNRAENVTGQTINVDGGFVMHW